ncbi:MAG: hypothetical protein SGARI_007017 [Bacillariaceae sp.]
MSPSTTKAAASKTLSNSGKAFFGKMTEERNAQLQMPPITMTSNTNTNNLDYHSSKNNNNNDTSNGNGDYPYRRRLLQGTLRHDKEVLIGPRGAPPGVQMPLNGLSAIKNNNSGNSSKKKKTTSQSSGGGLSAGPQGYYVLTPLQLSEDGDNGSNHRNKTGVVWINRGWVPKTIVPGADQPYYARQQGPVERQRIADALKSSQQSPAWTRPAGHVRITAVKSNVESE